MHRPVIVGMLVAMAAVGCGGDGQPTTPTPTGACCALGGICGVTTQANCTGIWVQAGVCDSNPCLQPAADARPDFHLQDVNLNSARSGQAVSPRDYLGKVSAWYFGHST